MNPVDLASLLADPALAVRLPQADAARLLLELAPVFEGLRVAASRPANPNGQRPDPEEWLDPVAVAERLGISVKAVYARSGLPWSNSFGRKKRMGASDL